MTGSGTGRHNVGFLTFAFRFDFDFRFGFSFSFGLSFEFGFWSIAFDMASARQ